jgi:PAS domain S-box-containing protein
MSDQAGDSTYIEARPKTLLLVEDEAVIGLAEKRALMKEGYSVIHLLSGEEAIALMEGELGSSIDLILMDIDLRDGIDGPRAAMEILRRHDLPVVFLSSHTEKAIVAETEEITNYGYILKNSGNTVLFASIKMAFKLHQAHHQLEQSEGRFRALIENIQEGICIMDEDDHFIFVNQAAHSIFEVGNSGLEGQPLSRFIDDRNAAITAEQTEIRKRGEKSEFEQEIIRADGTRRTIRVRASPRIDRKRRYMGSFAVIYDITDEKKERERLQEGEALYRSLFEDSSNAIVEEDFSALKPFLEGLAEGAASGLEAYLRERPDELIRCAELVKIVRANKEYLRIVGAASEAELPRTLEPYIDRRPDSLGGLREEVMALFEGRMPFERDFTDLTLPSNVKWLKLRMSVVPGHERDWSRVLVSLMDITDRKDIEDRMERAAREKDFLMRELEHRVKNNLNIVSSLLSLDSERSAELDARQVLLDAQSRIQSIALIYDFLSRSVSAESIDGADYARDLVRMLRDSYDGGRREIRVETAVDSFELDVKACVPLGLMVNELLSNAFKYAFPPGRSGAISVELRKSEDGIILRVRDDGVGLPRDFDWRASSSLGFQLVNMLSAQLGGTMELEGGKGLSVTISMPSALRL